MNDSVLVELVREANRDAEQAEQSYLAARDACEEVRAVKGQAHVWALTHEPAGGR